MINCWSPKSDPGYLGASASAGSRLKRDEIGLLPAVRAWAWAPVVIVAALVLCSTGQGWGAEPTIDTPFFSVGIDNEKGLAEPTIVLQIFLLMTVLSLAPAIMIMLTSFTRIVIVLSLLRRALGTNQMPPNQVMVGLALFLTIFIMAPVWQKINQEALQPYLDKTIDHGQAFANKVIYSVDLAKLK